MPAIREPREYTQEPGCGEKKQLDRANNLDLTLSMEASEQGGLQGRERWRDGRE